MKKLRILFHRLVFLATILFVIIITAQSVEGNDGESMAGDVYEYTEIPAGKDYKSWTGPTEEFDLMGATQFNLLTSLGLRGHHSLLDFGCGSLRAGRFFILYLAKGNYYCIEPYDSLLRDAINHETGLDLLKLKGANLYKSNWDEFDATVFEKYDFDIILAQSIFSHTGTELMIHTMKSFRDALSSEGLILATFIVAKHLPEEKEPQYNAYEWIYPGITEFHPNHIPAFIQRAGLFGAALKWYHPRQEWWVLSKNPSKVEWARRVLEDTRGLNVYASSEENSL